MEKVMRFLCLLIFSSIFVLFTQIHVLSSPHSIVDYLDERQKLSSFEDRAQLFAEHFGDETLYLGTAEQNLSLLAAMKRDVNSSPPVSWSLEETRLSSDSFANELKFNHYAQDNVMSQSDQSKCFESVITATGSGLTYAASLVSCSSCFAPEPTMVSKFGCVNCFAHSVSATKFVLDVGNAFEACR